MKFLLIVALVVGACVIDAAIGSTLWGWFAVPYLHAPRLTMGQVMAVGLALGMVFPRVMSPINDSWPEEVRLYKGLEYLFVSPLVALFIGCILHYIFGL